MPSSRLLAIALAVSVAVNLFAVAAGVTVMVGQARVERQLDKAQQPGRDRSMRQILTTVDPEVRDRVREAVRTSARAAKPDFEAARGARREAIALSQGDTFDPADVTALLQQSRAAETRGRARLETDMIAILQTLEPDDRKALSVLLNRHRRNRDRNAVAPTPPTEERAEKG